MIYLVIMAQPMMMPGQPMLIGQQSSNTGLWVALGTVAVIAYLLREEIMAYFTPKVHLIQTGPAVPAPVVDNNGKVVGIVPVAPAVVTTESHPAAPIDKNPVAPAVMPNGPNPEYNVPVETKAPSKPASSYTPLGCYTDDSTRVLKTYAGDKSIADCANEAKAAGFKVFGIQYSEGSGLHNVGGQCFYGDDANYARLGPSNTCYSDPAGNLYGAGYSNATYSWNWI